MPFLKPNKKSEKPRSSEIFLGACFKLILFWVFVLILMIGLEVLINMKDKDYKTWAKPLFTVACAFDVLLTARMIPLTLKVIRDDIYKDKTVKRNIWKLRLLILLNFICSLSFIIWSWAADEEKKLIKWLLFSLLMIGIVLVKGWFTYLHRFLKKYIAKLYSEPIFLREMHPGDEPLDNVVIAPEGLRLEAGEEANYLTSSQTSEETPQNPNEKQEESNLSQNPPCLPSTEE